MYYNILRGEVSGLESPKMTKTSTIFQNRNKSSQLLKCHSLPQSNDFFANRQISNYSTVKRRLCESVTEANNYPTWSRHLVSDPRVQGFQHRWQAHSPQYAQAAASAESERKDCQRKCLFFLGGKVVILRQSENHLA